MATVADTPVDHVAPDVIAAVSREETERLPVSIKVAWGAGGMGAQLAINLMGPVALFYLTTVVGLGPALAATLLMVSKLWDAFSDPFTGVISDRSRNPKGRRRPFLFWGAWITAAFVIFGFSIPAELSTNGAAIWALVALIGITSGYSLFNVPYVAMPAEMTTGYHERSSIHSYRTMFSLAGTALAGSGAGILLGVLGTRPTAGALPINDHGDYVILAWIAAVLTLVPMLVTWWGTRHAPIVARTERELPVWSQIGSIFQNRAFVVIIGAKAIHLLGIAASQAGTFFLVTNVLKMGPQAMAFVGIPFLLTGLAVTPLLVAISKRIGKQATLVITLLFPAVAALSWLLAQPGDPWWTLALRGMATGVGFSGSFLFAVSMITDAIEVDAVRTGLRREGTYMAVYSFAEKLAGSFGPMIVGVALAMAGFRKDAPIADEAMRTAVMYGVAWTPLICATSAALLVAFAYRIDRDELAKAATMFERKRVV